MAKGLFLSLPLHGHTNPTLPLVRSLVERGDEIVYYSAAPFATAVEQTGARYRAYRNPFLAQMGRLPERLHEMSSLLMRTTADVLEHELGGFHEAAADYVITDSVAPWGQWLGKVLGVPIVTSVSTFAFNRRVLAMGFAQGIRPKSGRVMLSKLRHVAAATLLRRRLRRRYGVNGPGVMASVIGRSDLNIVYTSRYFQPCAETFDDRYQFVGPSIAPRTDRIAFPWDEVRDRPVIYVSLGTLFNTDAAFYRSCFDAFRDEEVQAIVSVGSNVSIAALGEPPPNVIVRTHVPQLEVLARATAFVSHGGMNSVCESLYHGVPLIVVPQMSEQAFVGHRVAELGAGLHVSKDKASAGALRTSIRRLLSEPRFRQQAVRVGDSFRAAGGVARAADAIRKFTRPHASEVVKEHV